MYMKCNLSPDYTTVMAKALASATNAHRRMTITTNGIVYSFIFFVLLRVVFVECFSVSIGILMQEHMFVDFSLPSQFFSSITPSNTSVTFNMKETTHFACTSSISTTDQENAKEGMHLCGSNADFFSGRHQLASNYFMHALALSLRCSGYR
jgi:hypothetical protein